MGTRALLLAEHESGCVRAVMVNYDGDPGGAGRILRDHYRAPERVEELFDLGDLSQIGPLTDCPEGHSQKAPAPGRCLAYHRDYGEPLADTVSEEYFNLDDAMDSIEQPDYTYYWTVTDGWSCIANWGRRKEIPIP